MRNRALARIGLLGPGVGVPTLQFAIRQFGLGTGLAVVALAAAALLLPLIARVLRFRGPRDIGLQRDGYHQILEGLQAGELVATDGAVFLSNALTTATR